MNWKDRKDDWKKNAAEPLYINAGKGNGEEVGSCTPVIVGMGLERANAAPERVEGMKQMAEERYCTAVQEGKGTKKER
jgi:hypothetical protein